MPVRGRRGSYVGVTGTVVVLVLIGTVVKCGKPVIPPPDNNDLAGFRSRFLNRASRQGIAWRTTDQQPFAEAARLGRPVMVFAGTSASQAARRFDDAVFANREVWARLNRDFVCVRVDLTTEPEWRSAFLPILRNQVGADPGYAVWFFSPSGVLLTWIGRRSWTDRPDFNDFLGSLDAIRTQYVSLANGGQPQAELEQEAESTVMLQTSDRSVPDTDAFFRTLVEPRTFFQWQAGRYRALLQAGLVADARMLLLRDLSFPTVDLVDGGFFRIANGLDPRLVEFDKSAVTNAEMLCVLARLSVATEEPLFKYWYDRTIECIKEQFLGEIPWSSNLECVVQEDGRSLRHSFGLAELRTRVDAKVRSNASQLRLEPGSNPLMVPSIGPDTKLETQLLANIVASLKEAGDSSVVSKGGDDTLDALAIVAARTIEAALVMNDEQTLSASIGWARRLRDFRAGKDEVTHATFGRGLGRKWLGDFAAYADAMLMAYAATREAEFLDDGEAVLRRAIELFVREDGDVVSVAGANARLGPVALDMPSVADNGAPPALALFMIVCFRYGAVLDDLELRQLAVGMAERFSSVANKTPAFFPSFIAAAQEVLLTGCVVVPSQSAFERDLTRPNVLFLLGDLSSLANFRTKTLRYVRTEAVDFP